MIDECSFNKSRITSSLDSKDSERLGQVIMLSLFIPASDWKYIEFSQKAFFVFSSSPDILPNSLDPISKLIDAAIPFLQPYPHTINLSRI